ncbi:MAG: hypothetical protein HY293_15795 [Planctomycetes bacterium]|nr:hypothetical protein [Planctomycetota bacterium]
MSNDDLPMISPSNDSTQVELSPQKEVHVNAPEPRRNPTTSVPKPAAAPADPRKASEMRKPGTVVPVKPADPSASRPAAPAVKAPIPAASAGDDEDPEKLLREYAERQKTKLVRLEQQVVEYRKVVAERDSLRAKVDSMGKELQESKKQLEAAVKSDEVIKDLQGKVDAAVLSNSILTEDKEKLKKGLSQQTEHFKKAEERAAQAEKSLAEVQEKLVEETQKREEAEARVAAALEALQSDASPVKAAAPAEPAVPKAVQVQKPISEVATRPMKAAQPDEKAATPPPPAGGKPPAPPQRPPGRFSFLKK